MKKNFYAVATLAFAMAFAVTASAATYDFGPSTIKKGSSGQYAMNVQLALNACNNAGLATDGKFGSKSAAALMAFQAGNGLTPDGKAGAMTKAKLNDCGTPVMSPSTPVMSPSTPNVTLSGSSGVLTNVNTISGYSGLTLNAGEQSDKILGAQFTATGGDMKIDRLTVDFQRTALTGYYQLSQYITGVSVWNDTTKLASVPVSNASDITSVPSGQSDIFEFNVAGLNYVIPNGTTGHLYVSVDVAPTIDNSYASGNSWTATIPANGLRAIDASGFTDSYPGSTNLSSSTFSVVNLSSSGNVQLRASVDPSSPLAYGQQVNSVTGNTDNVKLLAVSMYAKPGSNIMVRKFPVTVNVVAGSNGKIGDILNNVSLTNASGTKYTANIPASCAAATTCTVLFGSDSGVLGWTVAAGTTQTWTVTASVKPIAGAFKEGDAINANVDDLFANGISEGLDAQDSVGNPLTASALTGGATGNTVGFYNNGITVVAAGQTAVGLTQTSSQSHQNGQFTLSFTVNALNSSVYLPAGTPSIAAPTNDAALHYSLTNNGTAVTGNVSAALTSATTVSGDSAGNYFLVNAGSSRTFTLSVGLTNDGTNGTGAGNYVLHLTDVNYDAVSSALANLKEYTLNLNNIYTNPPLFLQ